MNRRNEQLLRTRPSLGYTLLELILALALLGALMTVAWSLMGTFRDAEQRGWKLSHRTQTIRAARQWLQNDMLHLLQKELTPASTTTMKSRLSGNSLGFTASIAPSIDPLPFLEQLMSDPVAGDAGVQDAEPVASLYSDTDAIVAQARQSLWPAETLEVEYQLAPIEDSSTTNQSLLQPTDPSAIQFSLSRRELLNASAVPSNSEDRSPPLNSLSERVLTAQDLYRQTDETTASSGPAIRESRLDGLTNVQFQYFDGSNWIREWNSDQSGSLPLAVALSFDFPARAEMKPVEPMPEASSEGDADSPSSGNLLDSRPSGSGLSFADAAIAAEPSVESSAGVESGLMQAATHEVQIVVYLDGQAGSQRGEQAFDSPRGTRRTARPRGGFK